MQAVRAKRGHGGRHGVPVLLIGALLAVVVAIAIIAFVSRDDGDSATPAQNAEVARPSDIQDTTMLDESTHPTDIIGDGVIDSVSYPDGVMEATDVERNRAALAAVNPELVSGVARTVFLEQNLMLPGDLGHLDGRALSMEEILFLEQNTFLPDGGAVAFEPPVDQRGRFDEGFTQF